MLKYLFSMTLVAYSGLTIGGCQEGEKYCYHFLNKELVDQSPCTVAECANIHGGLENWTLSNGEIVSISADEHTTSINDKPGYYFDQGDMTCYGIGEVSSKKEYFCRAEIKQDSTREKPVSQYDTCLTILGAGMYNGILEDLCDFAGGVKTKLKIIYTKGNCQELVSADEISRVAKEVLEDTKMRYNALGEDVFCSNNKKGYYDLAIE